MRQQGHGPRGQGGFTLVEMMVAIAVMALMFTGAAMVLGSTIGGASQTRLKQHAVEVGTELLESARAVDYASVATQNITADLAILTSASVNWLEEPTTGEYTFDPDGTGPLAAEEVVLQNSASIDPIRTVERNGAQYTVFTAVTTPDGAGSTRIKRITTRISWTQNGREFDRTVSTIVTETRRGLPLPNFTVGTDQAIAKYTDQALTLPFSVTNNGARDNWDITVTSSPSTGWFDDIAWYHDVTNVGAYDSGTDPAVTDVSGNTTIDTGLIETDATAHVVGYIDLAAWKAAAPGTNIVTAGTYTITISLRSASQPTTNPKVVTKTITLTAPPVSCGCTYTDYWFHNATPVSSADSNLVTSDMPASTTAPALTALPNYDKNKDSVANSGRTILTGGTGYAENTATKIAKWQYQLPASTIIKAGTVTITVWVAMENFAAGAAVLNGYARYSTTGSSTAAIGAGSGTTTVTVPAGAWVPAIITIPVSSDITIAANKYLRAYVTNAGTGNIWVAYGTTTQYASIKIPKG